MPFDFHASYEQLNPADSDYRFYADLARRLDAHRVLDLGCGTGVLARMIAAQGRHMTGIDPDSAMLDVARRKDTSGEITWIHGHSDQAVTASADLAVMSGHVAQVFISDAEWTTALDDLHRALFPGGVIAFETRNPMAAAWNRWNREDSLRMIDSPDGPVEFWHETVTVDLPLVTYDTYSRETVTGRETHTRNDLAFRTLEQLEASLNEAGFTDYEFYGDWDRSTFNTRSPEIITIARASRTRSLQ